MRDVAVPGRPISDPTSVRPRRRTPSSRRRFRTPSVPGETFELTPPSPASSSSPTIPTSRPSPSGSLVGCAARPASPCRSAVTPGDDGDVVVTRDAIRRPRRRGLHPARRLEPACASRPATPAGVFRALTTLRQMLPAAAEATSVQPGPWTVAGAEISDRPRFEYRGTMLDVARHFFAVDDVLRYIELISLYKVNVLHLHLTDDQGWRLTRARLAAAHRGRRAERHRRRPRRLLQRRRLRPHRRLRRRALHRGRSRDRRARPRVGRPHRLPGVELRRRRSAAVPPRRHLRGLAVRVRRLDLRLPRRRVRRPGRRAGAVHPHRRRRGDRDRRHDDFLRVRRRAPPSSSSNAAGRR